jgi:hypothetical protein
MLAVREQLGKLLAADPTTLAPAASPNKLALIGSAFSASENLTVQDLDLLAGNGLDPVACGPGPQLVALDPTTNEQLITLVPGAASGFRWVSSGSFPQPISVYGVALTDNAGDKLLGVSQFRAPITLHGPGYQIDADPQTIAFVLTPMS